MGNPFNTKVDDFVRWCELAFSHYKNGYYADSLTNMRKSGEAACKLMVIYKYPEKIASNKIYNKSFKELIDLAKRDNLAPRRVINWLESIQIHGNIGTHDNRVNKEQVNFSIEALRMLILWMFEENLKSSIPKVLRQAISEIEENSDDSEFNMTLEEELDNVKKSREELEIQILSLKEKEKQETNDYKILNKELEKAAQRIKDLEEMQQKMTLLGKELAEMKKEADLFKQKQLGDSFANRSKSFYARKFWIISVVVTLLLIIGWLSIKNYEFQDLFIKNSTDDSTHLSPSNSDSLMVLVIPFNILQDNPNITMKFEEAIVSRLRQNIMANNLQMKVQYISGGLKAAISNDEAVKQGLKEKAGVVIFGEIFEPSNDDSSQVNIKYTLTRENIRSKGETGVRSFSKLTDSSAIKIIQEAECFVNFAMVDNFMGNNKYSDALALLYKTVAVSKVQKEALCEFLVECHSNQKNFLAAFNEIEKYIKLSPKESYPYELMAKLLVNIGQPEEAEKYYKIALKLKPDKVSALLGYADLAACKQIDKPQLSKALIMEAISYDSLNALSWQYLADWEYMMKNYDEAKKIYLKCIKIDPGIIRAKLQLAEILAFYSKDPKKAVNYIIEVLKTDKFNVTAINLLANIYTSTSIKDPVKAEYLFSLSKKLKPKEDTSSVNYGLGIAAYDKKNFKVAISYFLKAYSPNSADISLCNYIGQAYLNLKDYDKALLFLKRAYLIDSINSVVNFNLGYFYSNIEKYVDLDKASFYFERALITNPYDASTLEYLGKIYLYKNNLKGTKAICTTLFSVNSENAFANKALGYLAANSMDYISALKYYRKSFEVAPDDDEVCTGIARTLVKISVTKNINEALKFAERAVDINPQSADNIYTYSQMLIYAGDYLKATEFYYKAVNMKPALKDPEMEKILKVKSN